MSEIEEIKQDPKLSPESDQEVEKEEVEIKDQSELFSDDDNDKFDDVAEQIKNK